MARKTKEDALATRNGLLDAAERVFHAQGVARSSLNDIAQEAGTTRGAIYWHFKDKADLFDAMMKRATLPMERALAEAAADASSEPLARIRRIVLNCVGDMQNNARTRRVFEIAMHKVEYVGELLALKVRREESFNLFLDFLAEQLGKAAEQQKAQLRMTPHEAARGLHALLHGLAHDWFIADSRFDLSALSLQSLNIFLRGLGLSLPEEGSA